MVSLYYRVAQNVRLVILLLCFLPEPERLSLFFAILGIFTIVDSSLVDLVSLAVLIEEAWVLGMASGCQRWMKLLYCIVVL